MLEQIRWKVCPWPMTQLFERQQFTGRVAGGYQQPPATGSMMPPDPRKQSILGLREIDSIDSYRP